MQRRGRATVLGPAAIVAVLALPLVLFFLAMPPARATVPLPAGGETAVTVPVAAVPELASPVWREADAAPAATAPAPPDPTDTSPGWEQRWGEAALARMSYPWAKVGYTINFLGAMPGKYGRTVPSGHRIDIYVRPDESFELLRHVVAHELGHAIDMSYNDPSRHRRWQELRGIDPSTPWVVWNQMDFATPAGDFAETFAAWQVGDANRSRMAPAPDGPTMAALVPLFFAG
jgi:hypothetical protein